MQEIVIKKDDVIEQMYFVLSLVQNSGPMHSRIGGRNDYMGGIIDRYVNTVVESLVFTKVLFPKIKTDKKIELIRDFYSYDPAVATIAPDLLGITVNNNSVPFVTYNNGWKEVIGYPQVEIKTLKKNQRMLSLVNQHYDEKYLIITESDYKTDYLMPFINKSIFDDNLYNKLLEKTKLLDEKIMIADDNNYISHMKKVDFSDDTLGNLNMLIVTKTKKFIDACNVAGKGVTPECIEKKEIVKRQKEIAQNFELYCDKKEDGYYSFNDNWYNTKNQKGKHYRPRSEKVTLDFYCSDLKSMKFLKMNKNNFYIRVEKTLRLNNTILEPEDYRIDLFSGFDRSGTQNEEYFIDKSIYQRIMNCESELVEELQNIVDNID